MKNILITGASGFIGNFIVDEALTRGYKVYATVRKSSNIETLKTKQIEIITLDMSDLEAMAIVFESLPRMDYVIHNAGVTKANKDEEYFKINRDFTRNLVQALGKANRVPDKILYVSSLAAYGPGKPHSSEPIMELDLPNPVTKYGESKLMGEIYVREQKVAPYLIIRPTAVYGPGERDNFINIKLINSGFEFFIGKHNQNLTFIYVSDLVNAMFNLIESDKVNKCYFISDGNIYSKREMGEILSREFNKRVFRLSVPLFLVKIIAYISEKVGKMQGKATALNLPKVKELEASNWVCDISELKNDIAFEAKHSLASGLAETIKWYKKEGWLN